MNRAAHLRLKRAFSRARARFYKVENCVSKLELICFGEKRFTFTSLSSFFPLQNGATTQSIAKVSKLSSFLIFSS
jgi:hypothetical protein